LDDQKPRLQNRSCQNHPKNLKKELKDLLELQLKGNVKARILDEDLSNKYVKNDKKPFRSQIETYNFLKKKAAES
jgi:polyphosphate kinase